MASTERAALPPYDPPDNRTPEQIAEDAAVRQRVRERVARGVRPDGSAKQKPAASASSAAPVPHQTELQAMQGTRGVDYFPDDRCNLCGALVWFDGVRYQQTHDPAKHGAVGEQGAGVDARRQASAEDTGAIVHRITNNVRPGAVRRSYAEDYD